MSTPEHLKKHQFMPAKLAFYQTRDGSKSVALCHPFEDLEARCIKYKIDWDKMFPENPITFVALQDVEWPNV